VTASARDAAGRSVLFLIPSLDAGGAERQMIGLAAGLARAGWRVRVLTFYGGGTLADDLTGRGVVVESLRKGGRSDLPAFAVRLVRAIRRDRPDVVHAYLLAPNIATVAVRPFIRGVPVVWGVRTSNMNLGRYGRWSSLVFTISCRLARFADLIVCNSKAGLDYHAVMGYPRDRMVLIANGIDHERFAPDPTARRRIRAEWAIPDEAALVGLVGRLDPVKDHATFLRAAALVAADRRDVRFVCVGPGPMAVRDALERLTAELGLAGRVTWAGGRSDLGAVYNAFDLAVSSSAWGEGFPNAVAEAMATAVPCVVTDVGDSAAVVGATGWVCSAGQPAELAAAIATALSSPADLLQRGARARRRIATEFSEDRRDRTTAEVLCGLIGRREARAG
jgi:glycosyltransferase involved in cell wall biosynthesis